MINSNFRTEVEIKKSEQSIDYSSKILMLGSCFTTEIGSIMQDYRFNVMVNPFGTLYNPASIASSIDKMLSTEEFRMQDVIETNPTDASSPRKYASFYHHSSFARTSADAFLSLANEHLKEAHNFIKEADTIIITLGTAWIFNHIEKGFTVSNCHKRLAKEFKRELLTVEKTYEILKGIANNLPDKKIIFTVSPIRHFKD